MVAKVVTPAMVEVTLDLEAMAEATLDLEATAEATPDLGAMVGNLVVTPGMVVILALEATGVTQGVILAREVVSWFSN